MDVQGFLTFAFSTNIKSSSAALLSFCFLSSPCSAPRRDKAGNKRLVDAPRELPIAFSLDAAQEASRPRYPRGVDTDKFLTKCCWIPTPDDALLATAGIDGVIHILSVARSAEMAPLVGLTAHITLLALHPTHRTLLLSVSHDDTIRIRDLLTRSCLVIIYGHFPTVACPTPGRRSARMNLASYGAPSQGELHLTQVPKLDSVEGTAAASDPNPRRPIHHNDFIPFGAPSKPHKASIEDIAYPTPTLLITFSSDGKSDSNKPPLPPNRLASAPHILLGTPTGCILVYAPTLGLLVAEPSHRGAPNLCCTVSGDCRSIVAASEEGVIFRWE
ncbi:hypothetical protein M427DRAFT_30654 [Gonapodya prolifera JEL478]|uniref:WD40 repeat-like protein n=1 Tax=Gonapodya prolifera (strain JEL478) TaxID=1344416 RepID=A0A139AK84_GONPJ|nr:hypothetical protein M427DRAFT_30654 [Gonapodya prolifera JEL478]|eukprot:KXS17190.1 hypothetical protein M427DRAFT_30654 [Gonapodya prolifera JEL478]